MKQILRNFRGKANDILDKLRVKFEKSFNEIFRNLMRKL